MNMTDEDIDKMRETMAATSPLGAVANRVWGGASDLPALHEELIDEIDGAIRAHVISEAAAKGWAPRAWNSQLLAGITKLVARAMIEQNLFTETITEAIRER